MRQYILEMPISKALRFIRYGVMAAIVLLLGLNAGWGIVLPSAVGATVLVGGLYLMQRQREQRERDE